MNTNFLLILHKWIKSVGFTSCSATDMHWCESSSIMLALLGLFRPITV